jgi:hypothetical protein
MEYILASSGIEVQLTICSSIWLIFRSSCNAADDSRLHYYHYPRIVTRTSRSTLLLGALPNFL